MSLSRDMPASLVTAEVLPRRSVSRRIARLFIGLVIVPPLLLALALGLGFLWFVGTIPKQEAKLTRAADGIVVFTGGTSRVADAMDLLASGRGKRLLISGVHPNTSPRDLARLTPHERLLACCVDLDYSAVNTFGNAAETRRWARSQGFHSLIVVTSSYHMPRAMAELSRQLPGIELTGFPVVSDKMRESWWSNPGTAKLLISEYLKYIVAHLRMRFDPTPIGE